MGDGVSAHVMGHSLQVSSAEFTNEAGDDLRISSDCMNEVDMCRG